MNQTEQYQLNQWDKSDRIMMEDFNADNAKMEQALAEQGATLAEHTAALAGCGNCKIEYQTYVGTGKYREENANSLTFSAPPLIVFIAGYDGYHFCMVAGHNQAQNNEYYPVTITWSGNTVRWYSEQSQHYQGNMLNKTYYAVALMAADA